MSNTSLNFTVKVKATCDESLLDEEDQDVAGEHDIWLNADAANMSESDQAKEVLDQFHNSFAISVLDDFDISVFNPKGKEIWEEFED